MRFIVLIFLLLAFQSCYKKEMQPFQPLPGLSTIHRFHYKLVDDSLYSARVVERDRAFYTQFYSILPDSQFLLHHTFQKEELTPQPQETQIVGYNWRPQREGKLLFIQIHGNGETNNLNDIESAYASREALETRLDEALSENGLGTWNASDFGMLGLNILFEVKDEARALPIILQFLRDSNVLERSVVARRVEIDEENWTYDVIYPEKYSGVFSEF